MKNSEMLELARKYVIRYCGEFKHPVIAGAKGSIITDVEGNNYLDFTSGQICATIGHNHPRVVEALKEAAERPMNLRYSILSPEVIELSKRISEIAPDPLKKVILLSTGSESNEIAFRLAKLYTERFEIVGLLQSFHGLTGGAATLNFSVEPKGYGPLLPSRLALFAPYCYRCSLGLESGSCGFECVTLGFEMVDRLSVGSLAALIAEPIIGAGGILVPPDGYLRELQRQCRARDMLLILDEAITGFGRTGDLFAFQHDGVVPDILTLSKTLGGGVPIAATVTTEAIEEGVFQKDFFHGTSHVSDPLPARVALTVLDVIEEENLVQASREKGEYFKQRLEELAERYEVIGDVRGRGLMIGVEFVEDRETKEPAAEKLSKITEECLKRGLSIGLVTRPGRQSLWRLVPPLTTSYEELDRATDIIGESLEATA
ncbi:MAG: aspartate aminotransferase family protein [Candidatus Geothermarchaeales archaeon]